MALTQISTAGVKDDAVTAGKIPANAVGSSELADNAVDNAAVASNAAIAGTKISPDFGSQNIVTTGNVGIGTSPDTPLTISRATTGSVLKGLSTNNNTRAQLELTGKDPSGNAVTTKLGGDGDFGGTLFTLTNHKLGFATNNAAPQMVLDTSGRLITGAVSTADTGTYYDDITINNSNTASGAAGGAGLSLVSGSSSYGGVIFSRSNSHGRGYIKYGQAADQLVFGTHTIDRIMIEDSGNNGDVHIKTGNIVIDTAGRGIDFYNYGSGTSVSSNLLDDYEEGTWTPVLRGSGSAGTVTYSAQKGNYVKVGKKVTVSFYVVWSFFNGTGDIEVGGLPFTTWNNNLVQHAGPVMTTNLGYPSNVTYIVTHNWYGVDYFKLYGQYSGGGWDAVQVDGSAGIIGTLTYFANS